MEPPPQDIVERYFPNGHGGWRGSWEWKQSGSVKHYIYTYYIKNRTTGEEQKFVVERDEYVLPPTPEDWAEAAAAAGRVSQFNAGVIAAAQPNYAKQVGRGECYDLGHDMVVAAGATKPRGTQFGAELPDKRAIAPGDIIQFSWCKFEGKKPDGSWYNMTAGDESSSGMHTGIAFKIHDAAGNRVTVLEQNIGSVKAVTRRDYVFADLRSGDYKVYRPA